MSGLLFLAGCGGDFSSKLPSGFLPTKQVKSHQEIFGTCSSAVFKVSEDIEKSFISSHDKINSPFVDGIIHYEKWQPMSMLESIPETSFKNIFYVNCRFFSITLNDKFKQLVNSKKEGFFTFSGDERTLLIYDPSTNYLFYVHQGN